MLKKRILTVFLAIAMLVSLGVTAFAAGPVIEVTQPEAIPAMGETFTVTVSITGNGGFSSMQFDLDYNDAVLECTSADLGSVLKGMLSASNPHAKGESRAIIAAASADNVKKDGTLATFTFKVVGSGRMDIGLSDVLISSADYSKVQSTTKTTTYKVEPKPGDDPAEQPGTEKPTSGGETPGKGTDDPQMTTGGNETGSPTGFKDVADGHWAAASIKRASELGLVTGYSDGTFRPNDAVTRAQFVTMLWRMAGEPKPTKECAFTDVQKGWSYDAVAWAAENGYVTGTGATTFDPNGKITREQAMAILFRYSGSQTGMEIMFYGTYDGAFTDSARISSYARSAVYWGIYKGLISGIDSKTLAPKNTASRAQIAVIFLRYMDNIIAKEDAKA